MKELNEKLMEISQSLLGIGALFEQQMRAPSYDQNELYGLGVLMKKLARELGEIEKVLELAQENDESKNKIDK